MPVTAKRSRRLDEILGDEVTNELVSGNQRFGTFETQVVRQFGKVETQISDFKAELLATQLTQTRWLVGIWATLALAIIGLYLR